MDRSHISLSELSGLINSALVTPTLSNRWVVAEVANINVNRTSGHCYLELVEKSPVSSQTLASIKATIWSTKYKMISSYFAIEAGCDIAVGMKIMFCCTISYHAVYSLAINITDIDPTYTIGEAQRQRNLIIETLKKDGIFDMNKDFELPIVIQNIAVISSATAAGYEDFLHQLNDTPYRFNTTLFPALMQGKETQDSVCEALSRIANSEADFDVVVIIRGGGATTDLQWFDSYEICSYIAQMPLPVLTGIGHQKDLSVADMVANMSLKTPTAVASFIIESADGYYSEFLNIYDGIVTNATKVLEAKATLINNISLRIVDQAKDSLNRQDALLQRLSNGLEVVVNQSVGSFFNRNSLLRERLDNYSTNALQRQLTRLDHMSALVASSDPKNVLKRGFAIVKVGHRIVSSADQVSVDDTIEIQIKDKNITSKVIQIS